MTRTYTKTRRAEREAETRERIVEAALDLHSSVGPSRTTISMIAERAGVQRHTVYAHFPDDRTLLMACSGLHLERDPLPSPEAWETINDPSTRLRQALSTLYAWFARNEELVGAVLRDAEQSAVLHDVANLRFGTALSAIHASLADGMGPRGRAALTLALHFHTWRTLTRNAELDAAGAVELMVRTVLGADAD